MTLGSVLAGCASGGAQGSRLSGLFSSAGGASKSASGRTAFSAGGAPPLPTVSEEIENIENIINAQGMTSNGVFSIEIDRNDIKGVTLRRERRRDEFGSLPKARSAPALT